MTGNGRSYYFMQDHFDSTVGLTDSGGDVTDSNSYDSFGNATNGLSTRYQFTGREFDSFRGLQYSRARFYDPQIGRFISEDPIGFCGGDVNLYGYARNNPLMFKDPMGLWPPGYYPLPKNLRLLRDFLTGDGETFRTYGPDSVEMKEFQNSPGVAALRDYYYSRGCENSRFTYDSGQAFLDTVVSPAYWPPFIYYTESQVGGFGGASAANVGDGTVEFRVQNVAGFKSFSYHQGTDYPDGYHGPFRSIYQNFDWREPINRSHCHCYAPPAVAVPLPFPTGPRQ